MTNKLGLKGRIRGTLEARKRRAAREAAVARLAADTEVETKVRHPRRAQSKHGPYQLRLDACLHRLFEEQVDRSPEATALICGDDEIRYAELDRRADELARRLRDAGVGPEVLVGICLERSPELVIWLLGILKAGGAYVPLEPSYPTARLELILEDAAVPVLVTEPRLAAGLPMENRTVLFHEPGGADTKEEVDERLHDDAQPRNLAYVLYTSGTTGRPKGVCVEHASVVNYVAWAASTYASRGGTTSPLFSPVSFDLTVTSLYVPLLTGGAVVLIPGDGPDAVAKAFSGRPDHSFFKLTPSQLDVANRLLDPAEAAASTRVLVTGGESLYPAQLDLWRRHAPATEIFNEYGPTETTVGCTVYPVQPDDAHTGVLPLGEPIANTRAYVLDEELQLAAPGVEGELHVGGVQVARGYLGQPGATAEKFLPDPFGPPGARMYATGDRAQVGQDGALEFRGRIDDQVKIRGYRIELAEVEAMLARHDGIRAAAATAFAGTNSGDRLVAYVVPRSEGPADGDGGRADTDIVARWRAVFDSTFAAGGRPADPTFETVGLNSSFDGKPLPEAEAREWVETTVDRIRGLRPRSVLEIGCGAGLLLFRLAPGCERYVGTDLSQDAIASVTSRLHVLGEAAEKVSVFCRDARDVTGFDPQSFDVVVVNSVVEFFPSLDYLREVLRACLPLLTPDGKIFVGDVRSLPLLDAFHTEVQLQRASDSMPAAELAAKVEAERRREPELVVDPSFFDDLAWVEDDLAAELLVRRGRAQNELTCYRYDAVVFRNASRAVEFVRPAWSDWQAGQWSLARLEGALASGAREIALRNVPNARVAGAVEVAQSLDTPHQEITAGALKRRLSDAALGAVDPEELWAVGERRGFATRVGWDGWREDGSVTAVFRRVPGSDRWIVADRGPARIPAANEPTRAVLERDLAEVLRSYAETQLPQYMVPTDFVVLDALPLTANGKIDRAALPRPVPAARERDHADPPATERELTLAKIWGDVLGAERVARHDNFFSLGGDSILAIEVVSRSRAAGLDVSLAQIFQHPTVAELSAALRPIADPPDGAAAEAASGRIRLTPTLCWFFENAPADLDLYSEGVVTRPRHPLDPAVLRRAVESLVHHHEMLRVRLDQEHGDRKVVVPALAGAVDVFDHVTFETLGPGGWATAVERLAATARDAIDLAQGRPIRVVYAEVPSTGDARLVVLAHHFATDAVSWRILMSDLETAYGQLASDRPAELPAATSPYRLWAERLHEHARSAAVIEQASYWDRLPWHRARRLPRDHATGANVEAAVRTISLALDSGETSALLHEVPRALDVRLLDLLLAAVAHSVRAWTGENSVLVDVVTHGRDQLFDDVDLSRTVGWVAQIFPMLVETSPEGLAATARAARARLDDQPLGSVGYGLVRYLGPPALKQRLRELPQAEISVNYRGQTDRASAPDPLFALAAEPLGSLVDPRTQRPYLFDVDARVVSGRLELTWRYSAEIHDAETVAALADRCAEYMRRLALSVAEVG